MLLTEECWLQRRAAHERRVAVWLQPYLARKWRGEAHPVEDFLFTYYSFRPGQLRRWHPGFGVSLQGADPVEFGPQYVIDSDGHVRVDAAAIVSKRRESIEWIRRLLSATASRQPHFGCLGMHEWAMVYRQHPRELRHSAVPLRLGARASAALVDEVKVKCSHFDAFRFFTDAARPLNLLQPTREAQIDNEQPGCLHANMDVYRWAYKLVPLVSSELVVDCYEFAREVRTVDMRASPYDLSDLGLPPIKVETSDGRAEYIRCQRGFATRAATLRNRLIRLCDSVLIS